MSFNFQKALSTGAEQAKQKKVNSKIIYSTFENFSTDIGKFIKKNLNTEIVTEFEKIKPINASESTLSLLALDMPGWAQRGGKQKNTGYFMWLLKNPVNKTSVKLFSYKEGRAGFPVQLKIDDDTTICDNEDEVIEFLEDLASDSAFHFTLNKIK